MNNKVVLNIIGLCIGIVIILAGYMLKTDPLVYIVDVIFMIFCFTNFFFEIDSGCLFILFKQGSDEIVMANEGRLIKSNKNGIQENKLAINGFKERFDANNFKSVKYNIGGFKKLVYFGYTDGVNITPFETISIVGEKHVMFVNNKQLSYFYQKMKAVSKVAKPKNDMIIGLTVGVMVVILLCTITLIYNGGKLDFIANKLDFLKTFADKIDILMDQGYYSVTQVGDAINNTNIELPPIP